MNSLEEIIHVLDEHFPLSTQESWDNSGLQIGNPSDGITGAVLSLDLTDEVIDKAVETGSNLIITHHPLFFRPVTSLTEDNPKGMMAIRLIRERINLYSLHTPADKAEGGLNDWIVEKLGLISPEHDKVDGFLITGTLPEPVSAEKFAMKLKEIFGLEQMEADFSYSSTIRKVAVCSGSGVGCAETAIAHGADTLVTGDVKWSNFIELHGRLNICNVTHFHSEKQFAEIVSCVIKKKFPKFALQVHNVNITKYW